MNLLCEASCMYVKSNLWNCEAGIGSKIHLNFTLVHTIHWPPLPSIFLESGGYIRPFPWESRLFPLSSHQTTLSYTELIIKQRCSNIKSRIICMWPLALGLYWCPQWGLISATVCYSRRKKEVKAFWQILPWITLSFLSVIVAQDAANENYIFPQTF